jgi:ATP dependent DNA ligase domain
VACLTRPRSKQAKASSPMSLVTAGLRFIEPQLASPVDQPPEGNHWIHEVKYDGYRCQVLLEQGQARVFTRNGHDWSDRYPSIVRAGADLRCQSAIIDGEAIVQDDNGLSDFEALQFAMSRQPQRIILYAFDLMHLDGADLRRQSLSIRRSILRICSEAMRKAAFSSAMSSMVTVTLYSKPALNEDLKASYQSSHWHPIALVAPGLGSRPNASPNRPLWWSGLTATARQERSGLCSRTLAEGALIMLGLHSSPLVTRGGESL